MLKSFFSRKAAPAAVAEDPIGDAPMDVLHMDALDACVGGRDESHGVACYLRSTPSQVH
jgi:hypothetical protein